MTDFEKFMVGSVFLIYGQILEIYGKIIHSPLHWLLGWSLGGAGAIICFAAVVYGVWKWFKS